MPRWLQYLLALLVLLVIAPGVAWIAHKEGRKFRRGAAMAALLLGFGIPFDIPRRPPAEDAGGAKKGPRPAGDPPEPQSDPRRG